MSRTYIYFSPQHVSTSPPNSSHIHIQQPQHSGSDTYNSELQDVRLLPIADHLAPLPLHLHSSSPNFRLLATTFNLRISKMSHNTPDTLLKLAAELNKLGGELTAVGGKLAQTAKALEEEAANVALGNAQRWGVDVQVCLNL
jgi:hypothetical protein